MAFLDKDGLEHLWSKITAKLSGKADTNHSHTITASASDDDVVVLTGTNGTNKVTYSASHANSGVTAGTYKSVTVNAKGHVTGGSNPTTLSGYGITDAYTKSQVDSSLSGKAASSHTHDDRYYTEDEIDDTVASLQSSIDGKAASSHSHSAATTTAAGFMSAADKEKLDGIAAGANNYTYTLPSAGSSLGGVKSGGDVTISSGVITVNDDSHSHVVSNVDGLQSALDGKAAASHNHDDSYYTEAEIDAKVDALEESISGKAASGHTHSAATTSAAGFMSASDKSKLDGIATGANKTTVDSSLSSSSTNPVQNKVVNSALAGKVPTSRTVNGKALSANITLSASDVGAAASSHTHDDRYYTEEEIDAKIDAIVGEGAAESLDTIGEISAALKDNADIIDTLNASIGAKQATITGGATTITSSNLTANRALISDGSGKVAVSAVTSTELGYLDGVTSGIQSQLDSKQPAGSYAAASHGNHVPATETANNAKFLRNDNTWATVTPANIGAATSGHTHSNYASTVSTTGTGNAITAISQSGNTITATKGATFATSGHTHNYAGSSSAGGAANSVANSMTVKLNGGTTEGTNMFTFNGSATKSVNITPSAIGAATSSHTHDDRYYTESEVDSKLSGKANTSHGNHVPTTQTASNKVFLRNDNTWATVTPANIGAAAFSHTHTVSQISDLTATATELNYMDGVTSNVQAQLDALDSGKADTHSHPYAGSSTQGGSATSAVKLDSSAGSATQPVWFENGKPKATTYALNKTVPADAKFTDTTYSAATTSANGLMASADKTKLNATNVAYGTCSTAAATAAKVITISGNSNWALTTGSIICVKFDATNTAENPTFNVNSTGAKSVWYGTAVLTTSSLGYAGTANRPCFYMYDGTQYVFLGWSYDANTTYTNVKLGHGYTTCSTAAATTAKTASLSSYTLTTGGIVAVKFTYDVPASATLNINSKGAKSIYHNGAAIKAGVIKAGDTATFIYSSQYHLIAINRDSYTKAEVDSALAGKADSSTLTSHTGNTTVHITAAERTNWNAAKTHADSAHAPSNAQANQNAFSNVAVGSTTIAADTTTDTLTLVGSNVTLTPDATNDKVTIGITKANVTSALGYTPPTTNTTYSVVSTSANGLAPKRDGSTTKFLRGDGTWAVPPDTNTTYSSLKNPYSLTIQGNGTTLTNGTYDGSAAKTVNITASSIGVNDYVVAKGTSGIWRYCKWNSGRAEVWTRASISNLACTNAYGSLYYGNSGEIALPFQMVSPRVSATIISSLGLKGCSCNYSDDSMLKFYVYSATSITGETVISIYVEGMWK